MWYDVLERLDLQQYTAHLLDFRGSGRSDRPADGHDLDGYASDLRAAIETIGVPVTIVAHSMGAKVTQYVAVSSPPLLQRLILVAPGTARGVRPDERHRALAVAAFGSRDRIRAFVRAAMSREISEQAMERLVIDALVGQREAWFGWYDRGRTVDFSDLLGAIAVPTYILAAEGDPLAPPARVRREVAAAIPGAVFVLLHGIGHNIAVESPENVATLISRVA